MAYRDAEESLRARRDRVAADLGAARRAAAEAREQAKRAESLEKELAETEALLQLHDAGGRTSLPLLENVRIAAPCNASWEEMTGDARVRFCGHCRKNVYNLSAMPRAEAELLLEEREGRICVRLYKRTDGTVLTADCPVGVRRRHRRRLAMAAVGTSVMAAASAAYASLAATQGECARPTQVETMMGEAVAPAMGEPVVPQMGSALVPPPPAPTSTSGHHVMGRMKSTK
jgi:hypothetical protein